MTTKKEFLKKHNSLASKDLQATMEMLNRFEKEKPALFEGDNFSIRKVRRPFIFWLTSSKNRKGK